jgi:hypothetical protein
MQNILLLVVVVASIAAASIVGLNVTQVVYAKSSTSGTCPCGSGNPHVVDPDNPEQRTNPNHPEKIIGNPHDIESGIFNGNPHKPPE